jgi:hypothetical protein
MFTLKRRRKRRVPSQRGRGAISGLFFCFAQFSIPTKGVSSNRVVLFECFSKAAFQSFRGSALSSASGEERLDLGTNLEENFEVVEAHLCQIEG